MPERSTRSFKGKGRLVRNRPEIAVWSRSFVILHKYQTSLFRVDQNGNPFLRERLGSIRRASATVSTQVFSLKWQIRLVSDLPH